MTESRLSDVSICSLKDDIDLPEVSKLFKDEFLVHEPTCRALHVVPEEVIDWYQPILNGCLESGLSLGVRDKSSNALVAMMLNKVLTPKDKTTLGDSTGETSNKQILILKEIFNEIENEVDIFTKYKVEKVLELAILTVDPKYSGRGLGKMLIEKSEELALNNGCQLANVQASNVVTQSMFKKRNYETYLTYSLKGKAEFDLKSAGETNCWLMMAKPLGEAAPQESCLSDVSICSLKDDTDLPEVLKLFKDEFLVHEPTCRALHVVPEEVIDWYTPILERCLESGLSLGVRDKSSNALVAMMLNKVLTPKDKITFGHSTGETSNKQILILSKIFNEVENEVDIFTKYRVEKVLELAILTVDPKYSGRGLGKMLIEKSEELALNNGCQLANVQASNIVTQSIFSKRNYETYLTYSLKGKAEFDLKSAGETNCWLMMAKPLGEAATQRS